jgi:hypothetical protein
LHLRFPSSQQRHRARGSGTRHPGAMAAPGEDRYYAYLRDYFTALKNGEQTRRCRSSWVGQNACRAICLCGLPPPLPGCWAAVGRLYKATGAAVGGLGSPAQLPPRAPAVRSCRHRCLSLLLSSVLLV